MYEDMRTEIKTKRNTENKRVVENYLHTKTKYSKRKRDRVINERGT